MSDTHFISVDCRGELSANALCFSILESWPAGPLSSTRIRPRSRDSAVNSQEFTRIAVSTYLCFTPETGRENREFYEGRGKTPHWLFPLCSDNPFCTSPLTFNFHFPEWKMEFVKSSLTIKRFKLALHLTFRYYIFEMDKFCSKGICNRESLNLDRALSWIWRIGLRIFFFFLYI